MKSLLLSMLLMASLSASAKSIELYSTWDTTADINPTFDINAELGRAWVNLEIDDSPSDLDSSSWDERIKVDGLSYDNDTKEIIYTDENGDVAVCANTRTRGRGIFRNTRLLSTKTCKFKKGTKVKMVDDGYHIRKRVYQTISLIISK